MEPTMPRIYLLSAALLAACRLDPLVEDTPGASANVLPSDAMVQAVTANMELTNQITSNDSLGAQLKDGVIQRQTGGRSAGGAIVSFWAFGEAERAPAPIYLFGTGDPAGAFERNSHPPLVDAVPGDREYEPIHTIYNVRVTDKYRGEKITTTAALNDAIDLGLVEAPIPIEKFINWPIVRPGVKLDAGAAQPVMPTQVYARGYLVDSFPLGGAFSVQNNPNGLLPTAQVSFLRGPNDGPPNTARPIFQANLPTTESPAYTPVSIVVNVDLNVDAAAITKDSDLFSRSMSGAIVGTTDAVRAYQITTMTIDLQIQFMDGVP
jgi:hypothetical protein